MMSPSKPLRVILSEFAWRTYGDILKAAVSDIEPRIVTPDTVPDLAGAEIAFVTRDMYLGGTRSKPAPAFVRFIDILRGAPDLKWLHTYTAGADHRFYVELMAQGLTVATSAGANSDVVAHSALSGLLALARRLPASMDSQRRHAWEPLYSNEPRDLLGQRAVIVGLGPIGQEIGRLCVAFGLEVTGVRHTAGLTPPAGFEHCVTYSELASVLPDADWLILSCPLSDSTRKIINADKLARLPAQAQIINVARGEVVEQSDLLAALQARKIAGAYLDVFEVEPLPPDSGFWDLPNVLVISHSAAASDGHGRRVANAFAKNLARWAEGKPLLNVAEA
jgi:D-2-hydroxyacid dehydrogenase (NADP+)